MKFHEDMLGFGWNDNIWRLSIEIEHLFEKKMDLTLSEIKSILKIDDDKILIESLYLLFIRGKIVKDDFWNLEPKYFYVEPYRQDSSYTKAYYSFTVDDCRNKKFLLIADTHIGDNEMENFKLLRRVYEKGIELNATKCFHLGDIFAGKCTDYSDEEMERQLERFIQNYPNFGKEEMMTYSLIGNNDEWIHGSIQHLCKYYQAYQYDFHCLSKYVPSFYVFQRGKWQTAFQDIEVSFSHRFYMSPIVPDKKLKSLKDMEVEDWMKKSIYRILISGHLHCGFIYSEENKNRLFLGVPSTSNQNMGGAVAYVVSVNYESELPSNMEITVLNSDKNCYIEEGETFERNFRKENTGYQKIMNR